MILPKGCTCGHDHETHRGEHVEMCLECRCIEYICRCQNCGDEAQPVERVGHFDVCSYACDAQLKYAQTLERAA